MIEVTCARRSNRKTFKKRFQSTRELVDWMIKVENQIVFTDLNKELNIRQRRSVVSKLCHLYRENPRYR